MELLKTSVEIEPVNLVQKFRVDKRSCLRCELVFVMSLETSQTKPGFIGLDRPFYYLFQICLNDFQTCQFEVTSASYCPTDTDILQFLPRFTTTDQNFVS